MRKDWRIILNQYTVWEAALCFSMLCGQFLDTLLTFFLPCSVMIGLYARIFVVAKKHIRTIGETNHHENESTFKSSRRSERKAAKTLGVVVGAFIICWLPFFINSMMDPYINFSTPFVLFEAFVWLGYINSTINPIIYGLFYPWFRKTLYLIITLKIFEPNSSDIRVFTVWLCFLSWHFDLTHIDQHLLFLRLAHGFLLKWCTEHRSLRAQHKWWTM